MKNTEINKILNDIADMLEIKGENPFKIRAYQKAARSIEQLPVEVEQLVREDRLKGIPGVGEAIAKKLTDLVTTGRLEYYEKLRADFPEGISTLLEIPTVGPKTAILLSKELGIKTVDELEAAILSGKVAQLPRMGEKTAQNILHQIQTLRKKDRRIPIGEALPLVDRIAAALRKVPALKNFSPAGSLRRFRETVGDIDIMGTAGDAEAVMHAFIHLTQVKEVLMSGPTKSSVVVSGGLQADFRIVEPDSYGSLLQYFTGSKQHNINLRERARRQGLSLSEYGITVIETGKLDKYATEEAFYDRLGLQYIPPEIREGTDEIERAEKGAIPRLVQQSDIKGDTHVHTDWSDGKASIEAMALVAKAQGYDYIAITDHSVGRGIARGLNTERLRQQLEEIKGLNRKLSGICILSGIEVDIRADGSLDFPGELLSELDIVVAAVHSGLGEDEEKMTGRIIRALENPHVDILAHPTCRILQEREPVAVDMESVFQAALRTGTALEINAMPSRLDLKDIHVFRARELGVKLIIGTDAHSTDHLGFVRFGIGVARRGWCRAEDILNTLPLKELKARLKR
jgi:DNA polymerase (family X)